MTKAGYRKHENIIDDYYRSDTMDSVLARNKNGTWVEEINPSWLESSEYVLNDEYAEFRKALVDGKQIETDCNWNKDMSSKPSWKRIESINLFIPASAYRLKPKEVETKFKVGDFIRSTVDAKYIKQVESINFHSIEEKGFNYFLTNGYIVPAKLEDDYEKWVPRQNEWVWAGKTLYQYISKCADGKHILRGLVTKKIEPFIKQLPSYILREDNE